MKPTATVISRLLGKKFNRSTSYSSRIRGVRNHSSGFTVETDARGDVWVTHHGRNALAMVNQYDIYLRENGYETTRHNDHSLTVDGKN